MIVLIKVPGSPSRVALDPSLAGQRIEQVWTLAAQSEEMATALIAQPLVHLRGCFLEDHMHDWVLVNDKTTGFSRVIGKKSQLRYFSRVTDKDDPTYLALKLVKDKEKKR